MERTLRTTALVILLLAGLAGCLSGNTEETAQDEQGGQDAGGLVEWTYVPPEEPAPVPEAVDPDERPGLRFVALGDQGTGGEGQYAVAAAMQAVCAERGCDFAVALGDNIYESGVRDEYDEQFDTKFELPYADFSIPFYMTLGNHDNSMDPLTEAGVTPDTGAGQWYEAGDHEVAYHYRTDRLSEKWQMPARYYDFVAKDVTFFSLDTNTLMYFGLGFPTTPETVGQQEAWIDEAMSAAGTPWKIAFAHHPYISNGEHGDAGNYEAHYYEDAIGDQPVPHPLAGVYVKQFYEDHICGRVDLILSGHDHDMQWLAPAESCGDTEFIVTGAGGKTRSLANEARNEAYFQQGDTLGFTWIEIVGDTLTGAFYDSDGNLLFERTLVKDPATQ